MPDRSHSYRPGGTWFFTVNLRQRDDSDLLTRHIEVLRDAVRTVCRRHPFDIHAWVVLPDHLHCVIELPENDADFTRRWRLIKSTFSRSLRGGEGSAPGKRGIWQRGFHEHLIHDGQDYRTHLDFVHMNPVSHGLVSRVIDWPYSTFHRLVERGVYDPNWAGGLDVDALAYAD